MVSLNPHYRKGLMVVWDRYTIKDLGKSASRVKKWYHYFLIQHFVKYGGVPKCVTVLVKYEGRVPTYAQIHAIFNTYQTKQVTFYISTVYNIFTSFKYILS